jgi:hypothetical protein
MGYRGGQQSEPWCNNIIAEHPERFRQRVETALDHRKQRCTHRSQGQGARLSTEERFANVSLEQANLMADRGWGQTELIRRRLEAHVTGSGLKCTQCLERWQ